MREVVNLDQLIRDLRRTVEQDPNTVWYSVVSDKQVLFSEEVLGFIISVILKNNPYRA